MANPYRAGSQDSMQESCMLGRLFLPPIYAAAIYHERIVNAV